MACGVAYSNLIGVASDMIPSGRVEVRPGVSSSRPGEGYSYVHIIPYYGIIYHIKRYLKKNFLSMVRKFFSFR